MGRLSGQASASWAVRAETQGKGVDAGVSDGTAPTDGRTRARDEMPGRMEGVTADEAAGVE